MLNNFHTHTAFSDGKNTAEEVVLSAIQNGFDCIGFSDHGYTDYDLSYCLKDTEGYIKEIKRLKSLYSDKIEILLGVEEDAGCYVNRADFDYIIGSSHYVKVNGKYYTIDESLDAFKKCLEMFDGDHIAFAKSYFDSFCSYIKSRRPDIVGHFDLITKYDEINGYPLIKSYEYNKLAEAYVSSVANSQTIFEVNTGAVSRGYRTSPYPSENLLHIMKKNGAKVILSSDSHASDTIDHSFDMARLLLKDVGFDHVMTLKCGRFVEAPL